MKIAICSNGHKWTINDTDHPSGITECRYCKTEGRVGFIRRVTRTTALTRKRKEVRTLNNNHQKVLLNEQ